MYGRKRFRAASGAGGQQKHYNGSGQAVHHPVGPVFEKKPLNEYLYISRKTDPTLEAMTLRWMNENGLGGQNAGFCLDSITACVEMVKRGLGWGIVPEIGLNGFDGCVRPCIFENGEPFVRKTYLMCQKEALTLPQVNAFVELLKKRR